MRVALAGSAGATAAAQGFAFPERAYALAPEAHDYLLHAIAEVENHRLNNLQRAAEFYRMYLEKDPTGDLALHAREELRAIAGAP